MDGYELSAAIALWRGDELLLMKRAAGFASGGWFLPGGHVEPGERPAETAVRELFEETQIVLTADSLALADAMTYEHDDATAHCLVYNALCPEGALPGLNSEHHVARWYTPAAAIARFFDAEMLRGRGIGEDGVLLAGEVARVILAAGRARGTRPATEA